jgi:hypothetical protein
MWAITLLLSSYLSVSILAYFPTQSAARKKFDLQAPQLNKCLQKQSTDQNSSVCLIEWWQLARVQFAIDTFHTYTPEIRFLTDMHCMSNEQAGIARGELLKE